MRNLKLVLFQALIITAGCVSSIEGLKVRAESPPIKETFRKLSISVGIDGYEIESINAEIFSLETKWRELKENEKQKSNNPKVKLKIRLEPRGRLYDIRLTLFLQTDAGEILAISDTRHPVITKWKRILNSIVEKESKDGD